MAIPDGLFDFLGASMAFFLLFPFFIQIQNRLESTYANQLQTLLEKLVKGPLDDILNKEKQDEKTIGQDSKKAERIEDFRQKVTEFTDPKSKSLVYMQGAYNGSKVLPLTNLVAVASIVSLIIFILLIFHFVFVMFFLSSPDSLETKTLKKGWEYLELHSNFFLFPQIVSVTGGVFLCIFSMFSTAKKLLIFSVEVGEEIKKAKILLVVLIYLVQIILIAGLTYLNYEYHGYLASVYVPIFLTFLLLAIAISYMSFVAYIRSVISVISS